MNVNSSAHSIEYAVNVNAIYAVNVNVHAVKIVTTHPCENTTVTKTDNQVQ